MEIGASHRYRDFGTCDDYRVLRLGGVFCTISHDSGLYLQE
jgi:hypothetical protein